MSFSSDPLDLIARSTVALASLGALCLFGGCSDDTSVPVEPLFPEDYASTYTEVRSCRQSGDHDLNIVRVLADPAALTPYETRAAPFPVGATVLKEEYEFGDTTCSGPIKQWTVMQKVMSGSSPSALDWAWQTVDALGIVVDEAELPRCIACHRICGVPPDGYDATCTVP